MVEKNDNKAKYPVLTLEKSIAIMEYMSDNVTPSGVSITELSEALGLSKNNVHRIMDTLVEKNLVDHIPGKQTYMLGWGLYELAKTVPIYHNINTSDYIGVMNSLCAKLSESIHMGICSGNNECIILCKVNPNHSRIVNAEVGSVEPLHVTALGKTFICDWSKNQIHEYFETLKTKRMTKNSITTAEEMINDCDISVKRGYTMDDEENVIGVRCVAMPIRDYSGKIVAAISISAPAATFDKSKIQTVTHDLAKACKTLSTRLGYTSDPVLRLNNAK